MKTQEKKKLEFKKNSITELNDSEMYKVDGGTTVPCAIASSEACVSIATLISITITRIFK